MQELPELLLLDLVMVLKLGLYLLAKKLFKDIHSITHNLYKLIDRFIKPNPVCIAEYFSHPFFLSSISSLNLDRCILGFPSFFH